MAVGAFIAASLAFTPLSAPFTRQQVKIAAPVVVEPPVMVLGKLFRKKEDQAAPAPNAGAPGVASVASGAGDDLISRADELHGSNQVQELFDLLSGEDTSEDEVAWRIARAHHDLAEETVGDDARKEQLLRDGLAIAETAKDSSGSGYSLKWYAILLGRLGDFLPTKEKVANSYKIKESLEASAVLLPEDSSVQTALGQWCYKVAGISWVERNAAKLLFGAPPESSYEEALGFVTKSYELRPSKKAALFASLCHDKLKDRAMSQDWAEKCLALESVGEADAEIDRQAKALL